jgi:hypothetical protein
MQERGRRYIRFDSAQEFELRETPAQQDDYRIIARVTPSLRRPPAEQANNARAYRCRRPFLSLARGRVALSGLKLL